MIIQLKKNRSLKIAMVILLILFQQCGCRSTPSIERNTDFEFPDSPLIDKSFVTGQPCEAPCWYNLYLEFSTVDDIRTALATIPFVDPSKTLEQKISQNANEIVFLLYCTYGDPSEGCVSLQTSSEGKISHIYLRVYYPLTLETVIEKIGEPSYYISEPRPSGNVCVITIYWPGKSIVAHAHDGPVDKICVGRGKEIIRLDVQIDDLVYARINVDDVQREGLPWP